jgi:ATP-dependent DNA helicase DinG
VSQIDAKITTFAQAERVLAARLPGYESRPQQQALATFVEKSLATGTHGLAEAGCGTGKSLGALIPAILSGKRTVVATATIALQEQYANKDLPFLQEKLGVPFTWALLKGRSNYFCEAKAASPSTKVNMAQLAAMRAELDANPEHTGDREHFNTAITKQEFSELASSGLECPGKGECPFSANCFAEKAKAKASVAKVVITNTAMLMTDLKVREVTEDRASMLGEYEALIIDEAHELEEVATSQLEETFRPASVAKLVKEVENFVAMQSGSAKSASRVLSAMDDVTGSLPTPKDGQKVRLGLSFFLEHQDAYVDMVEALREMLADVMAVTIIRDDKKANARRGILTSRITNQIRRYQTLLTAEESELVRWVEVEQQTRGTVKVMHSAPIDVAPFLTEWLWSRTTSVLMSATMSVGGDFSFIQDRLGLGGAPAMNVGSPFDFNKQSLLFVPDPKVPSPKNMGAWMTYSNATIMELIDAAKGGALLLFTSRSAMNSAYQDLSQRLGEKGFTALCQGLNGTNKELAQTFKSDTHSVLFALKSFFTGVDIPGDACRLVVINKLPFPVPSEPVFQARADEVKKSGRSDFKELSIPMMTLPLVQGFGRLIRTKTDRGVVAILDSRMTSTGYGRQILNSLPDCAATTNLDDVRDFFSA